MARTVGEVEDEISRVYALVNELADQLAQNRALVIQLKSKSENVKGQATHVGTGFPLRRFNLDISDEEFTSELEAFSSHLVLENQQLQYENKQLNALLKEYEQTLETVMGKFRGVAHASQQHDLSLHSYYTSLLQQLQTAHSSAQLHDNTSLSVLLHRLSTLLRSALRALGGEETDGDLAAQLDGLGMTPNGGSGSSSSSSSGGLGGSLGLGLGLGLGISSTGAGPSGSFAVRNGIGRRAGPVNGASRISNGGHGHGTGNGVGSDPSSSRSTSPVQNLSSRAAGIGATQSHSTANGAIPPSASIGGYIGTDGAADWALEREAEIMRLEDENSALRELLRIAQEAAEGLDGPGTSAEAEGEGGEGDTPESPAIATGGGGAPTRRRSSLTVAELEAGAEMEAQARRAGMLLAAEDAPGSTPGEGQGLGYTSGQPPVGARPGASALETVSEGEQAAFEEGVKSGMESRGVPQNNTGLGGSGRGDGESGVARHEPNQVPTAILQRPHFGSPPTHAERRLGSDETQPTAAASASTSPPAPASATAADDGTASASSGPTSFPSPSAADAPATAASSSSPPSVPSPLPQPEPEPRAPPSADSGTVSDSVPGADNEPSAETRQLGLEPGAEAASGSDQAELADLGVPLVSSETDLQEASSSTETGVGLGAGVSLPAGPEETPASDVVVKRYDGPSNLDEWLGAHPDLTGDEASTTDASKEAIGAKNGARTNPSSAAGRNHQGAQDESHVREDQSK